MKRFFVHFLSAAAESLFLLFVFIVSFETCFFVHFLPTAAESEPKERRLRETHGFS